MNTRSSTQTNLKVEGMICQEIHCLKCIFKFNICISFMNGIHPVLAYADDLNLIGDDIRTIERNSDVIKCL